MCGLCVLRAVCFLLLHGEKPQPCNGIVMPRTRGHLSHSLLWVMRVEHRPWLMSCLCAPSQRNMPRCDATPEVTAAAAIAIARREASCFGHVWCEVIGHMPLRSASTKNVTLTGANTRRLCVLMPPVTPVTTQNPCIRARTLHGCSEGVPPEIAGSPFAGSCISLRKPPAPRQHA